MARGELAQPAESGEEGAKGGVSSVLACMTLLVRDDDWPLHPPRKVYSYLVSDVGAIEALVAQPVSDIKRSSQTVEAEGGGVVVSEQVGSAVIEVDTARERPGNMSRSSLVSSPLEENSSDLLSASATKDVTSLLRLRGVTPSAAKIPGRYTIDLKQQSQKKEAVEWLLKVENCGGGASPFAVLSSDQSWLSFGQSLGSAAPGVPAEVMLYFSRARVGMLSAYVVVRNLQNAANDQLVWVTMEVVPAGEARRPAAAPGTSESEPSTSFPRISDFPGNKPRSFQVPDLFKVVVRSVVGGECWGAVSSDSPGDSSEQDVVAASLTFCAVVVQNCSDMALNLSVSLLHGELDGGDNALSREIVVTLPPRCFGTYRCVAKKLCEGVVGEEVRVAALCAEDQVKTLPFRVHFA